MTMPASPVSRRKINVGLWAATLTTAVAAPSASASPAPQFIDLIVLTETGLKLFGTSNLGAGIAPSSPGNQLQRGQTYYLGAAAQSAAPPNGSGIAGITVSPNANLQVALKFPAAVITNSTPYNTTGTGYSRLSFTIPFDAPTGNYTLSGSGGGLTTVNYTFQVV